MMAQEVSEAPVASNTTSPGPNWWDVHIHAVPSSAAASWSQSMNPWQSQNPNSASSCEEDIAISATSFTNASSHSALTADTAATELPGSTLSITSGDSGENFMEVLSSKNLPSEIPEPAFNYLKKLDNSSWGVSRALLHSTIWESTRLSSMGATWSTRDSPTYQTCGSQPSVSSEGKKKRSEDNAESRLKKSKSDNSTSPSAKSQVPKVKLAERITALQQIVSPFGKTDTASVLLETINFIKYLHEQVQLLSDPYMKSGFSKLVGGAERKEKQEPEVDLKSRGLCLVPVACTPQMYRENNGPDYWTPTYRGCLYR
ncbi:unnamed protein product [Spirodela intermedia]|uniref:BHLH domain-containing protein n=1 Tax=Spirodela intermedia TaxID=51605 RepID=A0A7I8IZV7_SPIIN|nr:unnamed protein product [Spirodela intermedia]CAA6663123.1 unnamed protein product [Spirodela intermedia]